VTCAEATKTAWFLREIERSDGDVAPEMETPQECQREIYATSDDVAE
jgi:hypothetical protein